MIDPNTSSIQSSIDSLRSSFTAGDTIQASHINSLLSIWRSFNDHYHQTTDYAFEAFGNTAPTGSFYETDPENTSRMGGTEPSDVSAGDVITASKHQEIRTSILQSNGHSHSIDDRIY
jgi:hypothetical protein